MEKRVSQRTKRVLDELDFDPAVLQKVRRTKGRDPPCLLWGALKELWKRFRAKDVEAIALPAQALAKSLLDTHRDDDALVPEAPGFTPSLSDLSDGLLPYLRRILPEVFPWAPNLPTFTLAGRCRGLELASRVTHVLFDHVWHHR